MNIVCCPECGEKMRDESIGWRCSKCKGFVSFSDGKFYPHIERPFMPPMTNADRIRAMSDEELAELIWPKLGCPDGKDHVTCGYVGDCKGCWLDWLQ